MTVRVALEPFACSWRCPRCARDLAWTAAVAVATGVVVTAGAAAVLAAASWTWRRDLLPQRWTR